jgi:hypothetical protein
MQPCSLLVQVDDNVGSNEVSLFYRMGGERTYQREAAVAGTTSTTVAFVVPAAYATPRGLDVQIRVSDGVNDTISLIDVPILVPRLRMLDYFPYDVWQLMSVPLRPLANRVRDVLHDDLGAYDPKKWRVFSWNATAAQFDELASDDPIEVGHSQWLRTRIQRALVDIDTALTTPTGTPYELRIAPGWHALGTPFAFAIDWAEVLDSSGLAPAELVGAYAWNSDSVSWGNPLDQPALVPWQGYYILNALADSATVRFPPYESRTVSVPLYRRAAAGGWLSRVTVVQEGTTQRNDYFGFGDGAAPIVHPEPPSVPDAPQSERAAFLVERNRRMQRCMTDVRSALGDGQYYALEVHPVRAGARVELRFERLSELGATGNELFVWDASSRGLCTVGTAGVYAFRANSTAAKRLGLIIGDRRFAAASILGRNVLPADFAMRALYPNPFRVTTTIRYAVPENGERGAEVSMAVYSTRGRLVRTLVRGLHRAGYYAVHWDGSDDSGRRLANGLYVCRMVVSGQFSSARPVFLLR